MSSIDTLRAAEQLAELQRGSRPLVVPHAWDAGSARVLERAGAAVIGVAAADVAWSLGSDRAEQLVLDELLGVCARICRSIAVPATLDLRETHGAADEPRALVEALDGFGMAGITLPDAPGRDVARYVAAYRAAACRAGARLFVEAHIEAPAASAPTRADRAARYADVARRARACVAAGADGVLVTGVDWAEVVSLARELPVPVGVDVSDGWAPPVHALARAGVRRVVLGRAMLRSALAALRTITVEVLDRGSYDVMSRDAHDDAA